MNTQLLYSQEISEHRDVPIRYVIHFDNTYQCWNVFIKRGVAEEYDKTFQQLCDAQEYCNKKNSVRKDGE